LFPNKTLFLEKKIGEQGQNKKDKTEEKKETEENNNEMVIPQESIF
jgi:hypothetical protein